MSVHQVYESTWDHCRRRGENYPVTVLHSPFVYSAAHSGMICRTCGRPADHHMGGLRHA